MKTEQLRRCWQDWLLASDTMLFTLHEETAAVTLRDVKRVERLLPLLASQAAAIEKIDSQAVEEFRLLAESLHAKPDLRSVVDRLDRDEGRLLRALATRVTVVARRIPATVEKNRTLMLKEMVYIDGALTLLAKPPGRSPMSYRSRP